MGVDDLLPDDRDTSSSSSSSSNTQSQESKEYEIVITSGDKEKKFTSEEWDKIQDTIRQEMEYSVGEVMKMADHKKYEVIHEAAIITNTERKSEDLEHKTDNRCAVCGNACSVDYIVIDGERVHIMHNVAQVAESLDKEIQ